MPRSYRETQITRIETTGPKYDVPLVFDDFTLSLAVGFKLRVMWWLLITPSASYKRFTIPKANGKLREVYDPSGPMKMLQLRVRKLFLLPLVKLLGPHVTAYREKRSVKNAADAHMHDCTVCGAYDVDHTCEYTVTSEPDVSTGTRYRVHKTGDCAACSSPVKHEKCPRRGVKIHMDLRNFFPSTRASWIREYFREVVGYNTEAARLLASVLTVPMQKQRRNGGQIRWYGVPQGFPTAGDICNLVADSRLDQPLLKELEGTGWVYTRYADDLYLSHPENLPGESVAEIIKTVTRLVEAAGWRVNVEKTAVQRVGRAQRLLGMTVNQKPNVPRTNYKRTRAIIHECWHKGFEATAARNKKPSGTALMSWLTGQINWYKQVNPAKAARLHAVLADAKLKHAVNEVGNDNAA